MLLDLEELDRYTRMANPSKDYKRILRLFHQGMIDAYEMAELFKKHKLDVSKKEIRRMLDKLGEKQFVVPVAIRQDPVFRYREGVPGWIRLNNPEAKTFDYRFEECFSLMDFGSFLVSRTVQRLGVIDGDKGTISEDAFALIIPTPQRTSNGVADIRSRFSHVGQLATGGFSFEGTAVICAASEQVHKVIGSNDVQYYIFAQ